MYSLLLRGLPFQVQSEQIRTTSHLFWRLRNTKKQSLTHWVKQAFFCLFFSCFLFHILILNSWSSAANLLTSLLSSPVWFSTPASWLPSTSDRTLFKECLTGCVVAAFASQSFVHFWAFLLVPAATFLWEKSGLVFATTNALILVWWIGWLHF